MAVSLDYVPETTEAHVLEVYVPKRIRYLGPLYSFLFEQLQSSGREALLHGYSIYEVDGAFVSQTLEQKPEIYDEKTLVMRLIYDLPENMSERHLNEIAAEIISITKSREEEIWIMQYQATQFRFIRGKTP